MAKINKFCPDMSQLDDVAMLVACNQGGFIDAGPGTGKTRAFMPKVMEAWRLLDKDVEFIKVAPTFVAAKQMRGGITCQAATHRLVHNRFQHKVMIVDEVSMVSTSLLERMARWSIMGLKFVLIGDFSQLLPVGVEGHTRWRVEESRTFMRLACHLRVVLTKNRRAAADPEHFKWVMSLRPRVDEGMDHIVPMFVNRYPWAGQPISYFVCLSHRMRMRINNWQNGAEKNAHNRKLFVASPGFMKGCASQPQDMWIWPGMTLIGGGRTSRTILNGVMYTVRDFTDDTITVAVHPDFAEGEQIIELPVREAAENLRLSYAAVYHTCQGRTLHNQHVLLLDVYNTYFTGRHLYVGASRVTAGEYLHVASRWDQRVMCDQMEGHAVPLDDDRLGEIDDDDERLSDTDAPDEE
jgi:hypothetical protein